MKRAILTFVVLAAAGALAARGLASNSVFDFESALFNWSETAFDFGKIQANVPVTHEFTFANKGNAPLVITSVQVPCGCTAAEYTKDPVLPGQKGYVKATYNAARTGVFTKTLTVQSNTEGTTVQLTIKGEVKEGL